MICVMRFCKKKLQRWPHPWIKLKVAWKNSLLRKRNWTQSWQIMVATEMRQRRQRQIAGRRESSSTGDRVERVTSPAAQPPSHSLDFSKAQNFGSEGLIGFLKAQQQQRAAERQDSTEPQHT